MADEPGADEHAARRTLVGGVRDAYLKVPPGRRRLLLVAGGAAMVGLLSLVVMAGVKEAWRPVARGLAPEDLDAAAKAFDEKKIPYKLADEGSILVPPDMIHDARLALAVNAMPSGKTVGFELFDESGMGRSAFTERVNLHRALEGELARTIQHIDGVERVRVHLVTPERRVFKDLEVAPSASVIVSLKAGFEITRDKALAIRQLVSGAVERLLPEQVSIVDQHGRLLTRGDDLDLSGGDRFERQREQEKALEERVVHLLEPMVGSHKVLANVSMDFDLSRLVETREDFDPNQQVVRSEREQIDRTATSDAAPAGPPGTASNLPGRAVGARGPNGSEVGREKTDTIRNYEVDKTVTRKEDPLPRLRKLSVAVLVDEASELLDGKLVTHPRTKDELAQISRLVSRAVGLDVSRGDLLEVSSAPFTPQDGLGGPQDGVDGAPLGAAPEGTSPASPLWEQPLMWILAGGALLFVTAIVMFLSRARKKRKAAAPKNLPRIEPPLGVSEQGLAAVDHRQRITELRERALELGNQDPDRLAVVFERWFDEDREPGVRGVKGVKQEAA